MIKTGQQIVASDFLLTTTAGEALSARDACYIDTATGKAFKCDADDITKIDFVGFAQEAAALDATVNIITAGVATGFTLTRNEDYFLGSTPGAITTTPPAIGILVGRAISTSVLRILPSIVKARVRAYKSDSNTTITSSYAKVTFGTEVFDIGGDFTGSTFTAPRRGEYTITAVAGGASLNVNTNRVISIAIYKGGSLYSKNHAPKPGDTVDAAVSISDVLSLAEGDTIDIYIKSNVGSDFRYDTGESNTFVSIVEL